MTRDDIAAKLTEVLVTEFRVPKEKIQPDATFRGTLGLDSLDATDLVFLLCKSFGLKPDLHSFRDLHTVSKVVDHLTAALAGRAEPTTALASAPDVPSGSGGLVPPVAKKK